MLQPFLIVRILLQRYYTYNLKGLQGSYCHERLRIGLEELTSKLQLSTAYSYQEPFFWSRISTRGVTSWMGVRLWAGVSTGTRSSGRYQQYAAHEVEGGQGGWVPRQELGASQYGWGSEVGMSWEQWE